MEVTWTSCFWIFKRVRTDVNIPVISNILERFLSEMTLNDLKMTSFRIMSRSKDHEIFSYFKNGNLIRSFYTHQYVFEFGPGSTAPSNSSKFIPSSLFSNGNGDFSSFFALILSRFISHCLNINALIFHKHTWNMHKFNRSKISTTENWTRKNNSDYVKNGSFCPKFNKIIRISEID